MSITPGDKTPQMPAGHLSQARERHMPDRPPFYPPRCPDGSPNLEQEERERLLASRIETSNRPWMDYTR
jgi:hypothetical protein